MGQSNDTVQHINHDQYCLVDTIKWVFMITLSSMKAPPRLRTVIVVGYYQDDKSLVMNEKDVWQNWQISMSTSRP
jgi:hypothetical protein